MYVQLSTNVGIITIIVLIIFIIIVIFLSVRNYVPPITHKDYEEIIEWHKKPRSGYTYESNPILDKKVSKSANLDIVSTALRNSMKKHPCFLGLTATQLGYESAISAVRINGEIKLMAEPLILQKSNEVKNNIEGCVSIPNFIYEIPRYEKITISYLPINEQNELCPRITETFTDEDAFVIQHEIDHQNGVLLSKLNYVEKYKIPENFRIRAESSIF